MPASDPETTVERLQPVKTAAPVFETQPFTFVTITIQVDDREQLEFRREYDPGNTDPAEALDSLLPAVRTYLAGGGSS